MITKITWNIQYFIWCIISLIYLIFFKNFIFTSGMTTTLVLFFIVIFLFIIFRKEKFVTNNVLLGMAIFPAIFISLNEYILKGVLDSSIAGEDFTFPQRYAKFFIYMLCFLVLPSILLFTKFKYQHFFNIILISILISIGFNTYTNIHLNFDRNMLAQTLSPVIHYDYGVVALSLLLMCYGFYLKGMRSYVITLIAIINILLIVLHGSRGAWLGLPIAFLMIFIFYWHHNIRKILIFSLLPLVLIILSLVLIPSSPIQKRLDAFNSDKDKIINNSNYNSSIGSRLLLWGNALHEFEKSPLTGVGMVKLKQSNCLLYESKKVPDCFTHAHNVYLQTLAAHGLLGLSAILFLFFAPIIFFIQEIRNKRNRKIYFLSTSGIIFISYIMICSLTDLYFMIKGTTMLYYLVVFTLISLILKEGSNDNKITS